MLDGTLSVEYAHSRAQLDVIDRMTVAIPKVVRNWWGQIWPAGQGLRDAVLIGLFRRIGLLAKVWCSHQENFAKKVRNWVVYFNQDGFTNIEITRFDVSVSVRMILHLPLLFDITLTNYLGDWV